MNILEAKNLTKYYGDISSDNYVRALDNVDITVQEGDFTAIMGPSGSGKSTLVSILSGIITPSSGTVTINSIRTDNMDQEDMALFRRRSLGFVFQDFNLLDSLTVKENIILPMVLDKKLPEDMEKTANELMKTFMIEEIANKYPYEISGGQQQRTSVARALVNNPVMLFADEPTGNLDSKSANAVMGSFEKTNINKNTSILIVTHDVFAASFCKKVIFIKDGKECLKIERKGGRKEFLNEILDCQAIVGGESNEF